MLLSYALHCFLQEQLSAHLGSMLRKFWSGYYLSVQPKPLRLILGEVYKPFASSRQQDAQEFLAILLDSLHEFELKKNIPSLSEEGTEPMDTMERREGTMIVTEDSPPVQGPPVQSPPVQGPPVQGPPVQGPPVQGPPVQSPPVQGPPVQGPHVQGPPVQSPSIQHNHPSLSSFVTDTFQGTLKNEVISPITLLASPLHPTHLCTSTPHPSLYHHTSPALLPALPTLPPTSTPHPHSQPLPTPTHNPSPPLYHQSPLVGCVYKVLFLLSKKRTIYVSVFANTSCSGGADQ